MESKKHLTLNDIEAYKAAFKLSNYVWEVVSAWANFKRDTVGKQYVRAVDSISANLAEGFGRYSKKDKINFYRYARAFRLRVPGSESKVESAKVGKSGSVQGYFSGAQNAAQTDQWPDKTYE